MTSTADLTDYQLDVLNHIGAGDAMLEAATGTTYVGSHVINRRALEVLTDAGMARLGDPDPHTGNRLWRLAGTARLLADIDNG
jgi:hypothetical protein